MGIIFQQINKAYNRILNQFLKEILNTDCSVAKEL